jgi:hypothetical protein
MRVDPTWNMKRLEAEIERCETESERQPWQHGSDIFWLMGWADLMIERDFYRENGIE